jgi:hypothetical protein
MEKDESIHFLMARVNDPHRVLSFVEDIVGFEIEYDHSRDLAPAVALVFSMKTGFRQEFQIICGERPGLDDLAADVAGSLARQFDDFVLLDNRDDAFNWFLFAPDGTCSLVEIFETEDSVDLAQWDDSEDESC